MSLYNRQDDKNVVRAELDLIHVDGIQKVAEMDALFDDLDAANHAEFMMRVFWDEPESDCQDDPYGYWNDVEGKWEF